MASTTATGTMWNLPNFVGELYVVGQNKTPFLNMIGGLTGGGKTVASMEFALNQNYSLDAGAQPAITETASVTGVDSTVYARTQDKNTAQIFQRQVEVSDVKLATTGVIGANSTNNDAFLGTQPVTDELATQIEANLRQISLQAEYSFLNGTYQLATSSAVAAKTRGVITACSSNAVAASSATLTQAMIESLLESMAGNGSPFVTPVLLANAYQMHRLNDIYGKQMESNTVGGVALKTIMTIVGDLNIVYAPQVPAATIAIVDVAFCSPVFVPVPGKGLLYYEEKSKAGMSKGGMLAGIMGIDYGPEEFHGKITGLATS